jgi:hypothetical protein
MQCICVASLNPTKDPTWSDIWSGAEELWVKLEQKSTTAMVPWVDARVVHQKGYSADSNSFGS